MRALVVAVRWEVVTESVFELECCLHLGCLLRGDLGQRLNPEEVFLLFFAVAVLLHI